MVTVTGQKLTTATDLVLFPSKKKLSMYDDLKVRGKKNSGADHHIVFDTTESLQKQQMPYYYHRKQTFLCTML